jgi:hypothetical protein
VNAKHPTTKQESQVGVSLEQVAEQKYKAYEAQHYARTLAEQEEMSIEQKAIQQCKAFAAAQLPRLERRDSKECALMEADALLDAFAPAGRKSGIEQVLPGFRGTSRPQCNLMCCTWRTVSHKFSWCA